MSSVIWALSVYTVGVLKNSKFYWDTIITYRVSQKNCENPAHTRPLFWKYFLDVQGVGTYLFMDFFDSRGFTIVS